MKFVAAAACVLAMATVATAQAAAAPQAAAEAAPNTYVVSHKVVRELKADELRDFTGFCFASTLCRTFNVTETWPLTPFCGVSECVKHENGTLIERVTDCGPVYKPINGCTPQNGDPNAPYPGCCQKTICPVDVKPVAFTPEELREIAEQERLAAEAAFAAQQQGQPGFGGQPQPIF